MMRARWLLPLLLVAACQEKPRSIEASPDGRATREPLSLAPPPHFTAPPQGVRLPKQWDGYVAVRADDKAVAYVVMIPSDQNYLGHGHGKILIEDDQGKSLASFVIPDQDQAARSYLASQGFQPVSPHPPDKYLQMTPKLSNVLGRLRVELGDDVFERPCPLGEPSAVGWSRDDKVLVVMVDRAQKHAEYEGHELSYVLIPVTK